MTESSGGGRGGANGASPTGEHERDGGRPAGDSWEQRAAGLASEMQRWLIKTSAKSVRDEFGGQVKKALRGSDNKQADSWATATNEPPDAADEAPECAWCPVCRAARRIARARTAADGRGGPRLSEAADVVAAAVRDALSGIDAILSYRPNGPAEEPPAAPAADVRGGEPDHEPGDRG